MEKTNQYLLDRKIEIVEPVKDKKMTFSLLHWNTLDSELCQPNKYPKIKEEYLTYEYRKPLISKEIQSFAADIVCLSEVKKKDLEFFDSVLGEKQGYDAIYSERLDGLDGLLFCFKKRKFEFVDCIQGEYIDLKTGDRYAQVYQIAVLKSKIDEAKDYTLMVVNTHLKAKRYEGAAARVDQAKQLVTAFKEMRSKLETDMKDNKGNLGCIIVGDMNDEPESETIRILASESKLENLCENESFTKFLVREEIEKVLFDYVFVTKGRLTVCEKASLPSEIDVGENGLPNDRYPSDHLSLYYKFEFRQK